MVVPFGRAGERRSRTTYRPTATPEGSTHVTAFTGTTSSARSTVDGKVAEPRGRATWPRAVPHEPAAGGIRLRPRRGPATTAACRIFAGTRSGASSTPS
ncbi:hypothetical protein CNX65_25380 [Actinosynnema pretiosum]|uniref:Uncharacterized protein n=1 Tax=Actinosynnema pretiosum TaxID=42197 RepID=A0A290ZB45_9PSEU|nr:hypothetical protein CNX65_25380 [Actinosynnema pretiosum]